jgi:formylglycine-generating enzyme required for sulfatase activity
MTANSRYQTSRGSRDDEATSPLVARSWEAPSYRNNLGFRCAWTQSTHLYRVTRGGGWSFVDAAAPAARARFRDAPSYHDHYLGFRCVRNA